MRYLILILSLLVGTANAQLFQTIGSLPVGGNIVELDFVSPTQGYVAVNYYCLKSTDGGYQWTTISSEQFGGAYTYTAMTVADSNHIYLGKNSGGRLRYTKDGNNWNDIQVGLNKAIRDISFLDTLQGFMLLGGNSGSVDSVFIMKTTDGGDSWTRLTTLPERGYDPRITFTNANQGLVHYQDKLYRTTDGGLSWQAAIGIADNINAISMLNDSLGMLAGRSGYLANTSNGGASWTTIPLNSSRHIWDIKVFSPAEAYALCLGGNTSYLWHSSDSGKTWPELANGGSTMRRMTFYDSNNAWFYGLNNNIYKAPLATAVQAVIPFNEKLYPNPFNDFIVLETTETILQIRITDLQGKTIQQFGSITAGNHHLITETLRPGVYFVQLETQNGWTFQKMVKL